MTLPTLTVRARSVVPALVALLLVALNLRLAITSASVLLKALSAAGELTPLAVVLIPAIPTAVFAVAGFGAARVSRLVGTENAVLIGMITLTVGLVIRGVPHPVVIVVGTVLATGGLAIVNVLLPAIVRAHFGGSIRPITTAYSTTMSLGAATAAAVAVPIATGIGTPSIGLAFWAIPALIATLVWMFVMPRRGRHLLLAEPGSVDSALNEADALDADEGSARTKLPSGTKRLATYFALQSLAAYVVMGLLPTIATDAGISPERSGALLGIVMLVGVPATAVFVSLARSANLVRVGFSAVAVANIMGILGLLLAPAAAPELWAVLLGLGMSAFPMLLALIAGFGRDAGESARVSAVAQSVGYSLATIGPLAAGAVHQLTGSWTLVLGGLLVLTLVQALVGFALSRATHARDSR